MQGELSRLAGAAISRALDRAPVVALLGPRQCGKTTLARRVLDGLPGSVRLDLERPSDRARLADPEAFFALHAGETVCLDEIQRVPELFPVLRSVVDERRGNGQFLVLGSASPDLLRQSSESLAGRISFVELTPFLLPEVERGGKEEERAERLLWLRGGFPRSFLARSGEESGAWREDFVRTFLERDVPQLRSRVAVPRVASLWTMCAHEHGQLLNAARLGSALGVSAQTIRAYLELLCGTFVMRLLPPLEANLGKRLVRSPKLFLRDTGILHSLLGIETQDDLLGHPCRGASWEGFVLENVLAALPGWTASFYRTAAGAELDLVLERGQRRVAVECKASTSPVVSRGFWSALEDLGIDEAYVVAPVAASYPLGKGATVLPLGDLLARAPRLGEAGPSSRTSRRR